MTKPHANTPATQLIIDRVRALSHRKTQAEIAAEAGFVNANFVSMLKSGKNKIPLDRVPALAKALEVDSAYLMRLALDQAIGVTAAKAIIEIFGSPVSEHERGWVEALREASGNTDPRLTGRARTVLRGIFKK